MIEELEREAAVPLADFRGGRWVPVPGEQELAEGPMRGRWADVWIRTCLRGAAPDVHRGRLGSLLLPAAELLGRPALADSPEGRAAVLQLQVLLEVAERLVVPVTSLPDDGCAIEDRPRRSRGRGRPASMTSSATTPDWSSPLGHPFAEPATGVA